MILIILNLCHGILRPGSLISNINNNQIINNIVQLSEKFDSCFIINDSHNKNDKEFTYMPEHSMDNTSDSMPLLHYIKNIKSKKIQSIFTKNTFSFFKNNYISEQIKAMNDKEIAICGFNLSTDILSSVLDLLQYGYSVTLYRDCCGDYLNHPDIYNLLCELNVKVVC